VGSLLCSDLKEELGGEVLGIVPYLGLPSGQRQFMIGEPVANARDLQRYKELLLEEQRELSSVQGDAAARVPAAGGLEGDLIAKPMPMRNFRSACIKQTLVCYERSKRHSLGSSRVHSESARYANDLSLKFVWKRCSGRGSAANAKNASHSAA
jgi:hypothetical protein